MAESQSFSESEEEEERPLIEARKDAVFDVAGMHDKMEDLKWPKEVGWIHSLAVAVDSGEDAVNVEDDLAREMSFYALALEGAREAYDKFQAMGISFLRPDDYYAEMVKSDAHMLKVRDRLLTEKKRIEEEQERRKAREAKKFAKEVQAEKIKERAKQKKQDFENVKKWRKMRKDSDYTEGEEDFPVDAQDAPAGAKRKQTSAAPWDRSGGKANAKQMRKGGEKNKNRHQRDSKFGYGGRKGLKKKNTADSAADMSVFRKGYGGGRPQKKQRRK